MRLYSTTYNGRGRYPTPLAERFWAKVDKNGPIPTHRPELGPCWLWQSLKNEEGYGEIREGGISRAKVRAHRVSWEIHYGPLPDGLIVCHHCDNPSCVRPDHLFLGTLTCNYQDMITKGRQGKGGPCSERCHFAKLTPELVQEIRKQYKPRVVTHKQLAANYGVSTVTIKNVLHGRTWRNVS